MQIICPHCGFTKEIEDGKLPAGAKTATCPKCRQKFELNPSRPSQASTPPPLSMEQPPEPPKQQPAAAYNAPPPPMPETPAYQEPGFGATPPPPPMPGQPSYAQPAAPKMDIPWETRQRGFFGDYFATVKMVLFKPSDFFNNMPVTGGTGRPLVFAIINSAIVFIVSIGLVLLLLMVGAGLSGEFSNELGAVLSGGIIGIVIGLVILLVLFPLFLAIGLYIGAAIQHLLLLIVRGGDSGYAATFRVIAYTSPTWLFSIVPYLGGLITFVWGMILLVWGLSVAHRTGIGRVIVAVVVIPLSLFILLIVAAIAIPFILGMSQNY